MAKVEIIKLCAVGVWVVIFIYFMLAARFEWFPFKDI